MTLTTDQLASFVENLADDRQRWQDQLRHDPTQRTYALIWDDDEVQAWLICWSKDSDTGFHDHDISSAAIKVIDGQVREDRLRLNGEPRTAFSGAGTTFTVPPNAIHRVLHAGSGPAVTIHAYSPPLIRVGAYSIGDGGELLREVQDGESELRADVALA